MNGRSNLTAIWVLAAVFLAGTAIAPFLLRDAQAAPVECGKKACTKERRGDMDCTVCKTPVCETKTGPDGKTQQVLVGNKVETTCVGMERLSTPTPLPSFQVPKVPLERGLRQPEIQIPVRAGQCPDPSANRIGFRLINKTSQFAGNVEIIGVVKNVGGAAYESGPNQQGMHLYADTHLVKSQAFQNLAPGQEVEIRHSRPWNSSSPAEGEFPPEYKLIITYDPDIRIDANPKNDDCNGANNVKTRSGADINTLFR